MCEKQQSLDNFVHHDIFKFSNDIFKSSITCFIILPFRARRRCADTSFVSWSGVPMLWLVVNRGHQTTMEVDFKAVAKLYLENYPSDRLFREHFGATPNVAARTWEWLVVTALLPTKAKPCHLLWLFYWWKTNALQGVCCAFLGNIDKNTFIKWRDRMEEAVSNIESVRNHIQRITHNISVSFATTTTDWLEW